MNFGTIHALDRVDSVTVFYGVFDDSSTVMSAALLPMPTTRMLPVSSSGVRVDEWVKWITSPVNVPGKSASGRPSGVRCRPPGSNSRTAPA